MGGPSYRPVPRSRAARSRGGASGPSAQRLGARGAVTWRGTPVSPRRGPGPATEVRVGAPSRLYFASRQAARTKAGSTRSDFSSLGVRSDVRTTVVGT